MKFRMVRTIPPEDREMYRVETSIPLTEQEALDVLRQLGSSGQRYPRRTLPAEAPPSADEEHWMTP